MLLFNKGYPTIQNKAYNLHALEEKASKNAKIFFAPSMLAYQRCHMQLSGKEVTLCYDGKFLIS